MPTIGSTLVATTAMRVGRLLRRISLVLLALVSACSSPLPSPSPTLTFSPVALTPSPPTSSDYGASSFLADLKADERVVTVTPDQIDLGFSIRGQRWVVNQASFIVYEFDDPAAASSAAAGVSPDGYNITRTVGDQTIQRHGDWYATPHFYRRGRLIVIYAGDDPALTSTLSQILGVPFAGGVLYMQAPPTPTGNPPTATPDFSGVPHRDAGAGVLVFDTTNFSGPWAIAIYDFWYEKLQAIKVFAGNTSDPMQGAVAVLVSGEDHYYPEVYLTPNRVRGVRIIDAVGERLVLQTLDQAHTFYFDLPTRRFVDSLAAMATVATVTPFPTFTTTPPFPIFISLTPVQPSTSYPMKYPRCR